ncbi:unnamed protein product, partial [Rotaria sp. Silwood1]
RVHNSNVESKSKKHKPDQESSKEQLASSSPLLSSDIENKKPNLSPPTEPLVSAHVSILEWQVFFSDHAEFTRDNLSNFRGNTENRVPIPQESVDLLQ